MKNINRKLLHVWAHWSSYVFAFTSLFYGITLYLLPDLFFSNQAYGLMSNALGGFGLVVFSLPFTSLGLIEIFAIRFKWQKIRELCIYPLLFLWLIVGLSFLFQWVAYGDANAGWLLVFSIIANALNIFFSGVVDEQKWITRK